MKKAVICLLISPLLFSAQAPDPKKEQIAALKACGEAALSGFLKIADSREFRFLGKVTEPTALCRGGFKAQQFRLTPWVDWSNYWGTGDMASLPKGFVLAKGPTFRGVTGALLDLEYERMELIKFNLFDNTGTYRDYVTGRNSVPGAALKIWPEMRLPQDHPRYGATGGEGEQVCKGDDIRARTLTGICNDLRNPLMGSSGTPFARNVEFESTFPDEGRNELTKNRHGGRIGLLTPDPQVISRVLFTRDQSAADACNKGFGLSAISPDSNCDYQKAPFFNVLAAYWIQFMTHDWFSHIEEGHNAPEFMEVGCNSLTPEQVAKLGCRPGDRIDRSLFDQTSEPATFEKDGRQYLARAPRTAKNVNTAWWDASQIYGFDETSLKRVKRDPVDGAKLLLEPVAGMTGMG
ncbi:MAG TPA: peroxidase family protein, partial [Bryobacteraceae bacterium]|nr:peroxidase family protein [Bryobacteraceae bacterium]